MLISISFVPRPYGLRLTVPARTFYGGTCHIRCAYVLNLIPHEHQVMHTINPVASRCVATTAGLRASKRSRVTATHGEPAMRRRVDEH